MRIRLFYLALIPILTACNLRSRFPVEPVATQPPPPTATFTVPPSPTATTTPSPTFTPTASRTPNPTPSPTITPTPSITPTPTQSATPTVTLTPTFDFPDGVVKMQANCRYGPGTAYLYSHGLYPGDHVQIDGRNYAGSWLWVKPDNLERHCWAAASVMDITGDIFTISVPVDVWLPHTTFAGPPGNVQAVRDGKKVTVSWNEVPLSDDKRRGYLLEVTVCQNGLAIWMAVQTDNTYYEFTDEAGCSERSGGLLYTAEKHGYSDPVKIPWPKP